MLKELLAKLFPRLFKGTEVKTKIEYNRLVRDERLEKIHLKRENEQLKQENDILKRRVQTSIWIDPTRYHNPFQTAAYEAPSPTTDGKVQVQGARYRAVMRQLQDDPGKLLHHHGNMQKKAQTVKLDPETMTLPGVQPPRNHMGVTRLEPMNSTSWML